MGNLVSKILHYGSVLVYYMAAILKFLKFHLKIMLFLTVLLWKTSGQYGCNVLQKSIWPPWQQYCNS